MRATQAQVALMTQTRRRTAMTRMTMTRQQAVAKVANPKINQNKHSRVAKAKTQLRRSRKDQELILMTMIPTSHMKT